MFLMMTNGYLILLFHFISDITKTGLVHMSLCRLKISYVSERILHVILWALALFRSQHMMGWHTR
jgi:hypothetical protein